MDRDILFRRYVDRLLRIGHYFSQKWDAYDGRSLHKRCDIAFAVYGDLVIIIGCKSEGCAYFTQ